MSRATSTPAFVLAALAAAASGAQAMDGASPAARPGAPPAAALASDAPATLGASPAARPGAPPAAALASDAPATLGPPPAAALARNAPALASATLPNAAPTRPEPRAPEAPWPARVAARLAGTAPLADLPREPRATRAPAISGDAAVFAVDLSDGRVIASRHADAARNPASNLKVVTSAAAVELLGADYRFTTRVLRDGDTLYLRGEGDPSLLLDDLYALARAALASGELRGVRRIVADDAAFAPRRFGPGYDRAGDDAYLAPSGALSLQFNTVTLRVTPDPSAPRPRVTLGPGADGVEVDNRARSVPGARARVDVDVLPGPGGVGTRLRISGVMGRAAPPLHLRRRVLDPTDFAARTFAHVLADVTGAAPLPVARGATPDRARPVARHDSAPLSEVLGASLKYSNNFTAEQVLRTLAWRATGRPGTWSDGVALVRRWWRAIGQDPNALTLENASGLSRRTRLAPRALVAVLARIAQDGSPSHALLPALAVAGRDGTLRGRLPLARERVRGKTGTLHGVSTVSGLARTAAGHEIAFAVFMNNVHDTGQARREQDRLLARWLATGR